MATQTSGNLHLTKPSYIDTVNVAVVNDNMDTIDENVSAIQNWQPSSNGTNNQVLKTNGDGTTRWADEVSGGAITSAVTAWLDANYSGDETIFNVDASLTTEHAAADAAATGALISIGSAQPSAPTNKLWVKTSQVTEYTVPTIDEFVRLQLETDLLPDTTQTAIFDLAGNVSRIEHKDENNNNVRVDEFTFAADTITEKRTLYTNETLTIVTNTNTLVTTVTYAVEA